MRVLYILSGTETKGGATKSFLAMADSVAAAGNEVAVVVPDEKGITPILKERGWTVLVVPYMFSTLPYISWSPRDIIRFLPRLVMAKVVNRKALKIVNDFAEKWSPDIVHDNTSVTDLGHYAAKRIGVPHLIHVREYGWRDFHRLIPGLRKRLFSKDTYMVAITSSLASFRGKGLLKDHVRVIYNGVIGLSQGEYVTEKSPYFFYAGRIQPKKGVVDLTISFINYASSEIKAGRRPLGLKFAGAVDNETVNDIKNRISSARLEEYVEWLGEIEDLQDYYSKAAATIIPSKYEGFGRVMPEAMGAGSLCVARNSGGLAEQLENGRMSVGHDIAYSFDSVEDLTECLKEISKRYHTETPYVSGGKFYSMIMDARKVVTDLYSFEANARGVLDYYSYIMKGRQNNQK